VQEEHQATQPFAGVRYAAGRNTVNVEPSPGVERTTMSPPWARTTL
jgi:hypothetical protein